MSATNRSRNNSDGCGPSEASILVAAEDCCLVCNCSCSCCCCCIVQFVYSIRKSFRSRSEKSSSCEVNPKSFSRASRTFGVDRLVSSYVVDLFFVFLYEIESRSLRPRFLWFFLRLQGAFFLAFRRESAWIVPIELRRLR